MRKITAASNFLMIFDVRPLFFPPFIRSRIQLKNRVFFEIVKFNIKNSNIFKPDNLKFLYFDESPFHSDNLLNWGAGNFPSDHLSPEGISVWSFLLFFKKLQKWGLVCNSGYSSFLNLFNPDYLSELSRAKCMRINWHFKWKFRTTTLWRLKIIQNLVELTELQSTGFLWKSEYLMR